MGHKSEPLWELVGITKEYPGVRANDGISLKLYPGEIHALLGENGCGKSTLIKILSGVVQPTSGEIRFQGQKLVLEDPTAARCGLGLFAQPPAGALWRWGRRAGLDPRRLAVGVNGIPGLLFG